MFWNPAKSFSPMDLLSQNKRVTIQYISNLHNMQGCQNWWCWWCYSTTNVCQFSIDILLLAPPIFWTVKYRTFFEATFTSIYTSLGKYDDHLALFLALRAQNRFSGINLAWSSTTYFLCFRAKERTYNQTFEFLGTSTCYSNSWERKIEISNFWPFPHWLPGSDSPT